MRPLADKPGNPCDHKAVGVGYSDRSGKLVKTGKDQDAAIAAAPCHLPLCKTHLQEAIEDGAAHALIGDVEKSELKCQVQVRIGQQAPPPAAAAKPGAAAKA